MRKKMTDLLVGGGTGGHTTPLLSVATVLREEDPNILLNSIGQRKDPNSLLVGNNEMIGRAKYIFAGKFRRYHTRGKIDSLLDWRTNWLNFRDACFTLVGFIQSFFLLFLNRPSVIFIKGGFVGVPVGLAATILRIPFITHDSDATPGLANRIIGRWAKYHLTGMPAHLYPYDQSRTRMVGVPISSDFQSVDAQQQVLFKREVGLQDDDMMLFIVGGSQGARRLDNAVRSIIEELLTAYPKLNVFHLFGRLNEEASKELYAEVPMSLSTRVHTLTFTNRLYVYSGAADVILTRAGATNIAEFSAQAKACLVVPSHFLAGGHQLKNAAAYVESEAAIVIDQRDVTKDPNILADALSRLLSDVGLRTRLGKNLHSMGRGNASREIARCIIDSVNKTKKSS